MCGARCSRILNVRSRRQAEWVTNHNREHLLRSRWRRRKNGNNFIAFSVSHYRMRCCFSFSSRITSTRNHQRRRPDGFDFSNLFFDYFANAAGAATCLLCVCVFFFSFLANTMNSPSSSLSVRELEKKHEHRIPFESIPFI